MQVSEGAGIMPFTKGHKIQPGTRVPSDILHNLTQAPMDIGELEHAIGKSRRTLHLHLRRMQKGGQVERVYLLSRMNRPIYRLKRVKEG